ncbi:hypothetical protein J0J30_23815, partial [Vibrio vulnificus]|nr:hypothetical protein [Vibrio vulnificus]
QEEQVGQDEDEDEATRSMRMRMRMRTMMMMRMRIRMRTMTKKMKSYGRIFLVRMKVSWSHLVVMLSMNTMQIKRRQIIMPIQM